jgi:signal transduction histidine kinase
MTGTEAAAAQFDAKAKQISETRLSSLYGAVSGVFQLLLPLQWLGSAVLCLLQSTAGTEEGFCNRGLNPWIAMALSTLINGATFAVIRVTSVQALNRYVIGVSQVLFYTLLTLIGASYLNTSLYLCVSLGLLAFYREQQLLLAVAGASLAVQWTFGVLVCHAGETASAQLTPFSIWVLLQCGVLALICHRGRRLFRGVGREQALMERERETHLQQELERSRQLAATNEQYRALLESTSAVPWELDDSSGACRYIGAQVEQQWGWAPERFQEGGFLFSRVHPDDRPAFAQALEDAVASHDVTVECRLQLQSEKFAHVRSFMRHAPDVKGRIVRGISIDITNQKKLESELYQAQKLESIGRLAAGVAHEINTPVQFVNDNCYFLRDAVAQMRDVLRVYQEIFATFADGQLTLEQARAQIEAAESAADLSFLNENMPTAVERSLEGLERVASIVRSMKEFSHPNTTAMSSADLNAAIRSTLIVARNEYKYVAEVETHLGDIPPVICYVSEFNQVFLNILVNAAQAIGAVVAGTEHRGLITVTTRQEGDSVVVSVQDTGGGIPEAIQANIFDPFFTTKEVGKGTGQGLSIARSAIVDKHHGNLTFESVPGVGTTFFIRLPLDAAAAAEAIAA